MLALNRARALHSHSYTKCVRIRTLCAGLCSAINLILIIIEQHNSGDSVRAVCADGSAAHATMAIGCCGCKAFWDGGGFWGVKQLNRQTPCARARDSQNYYRHVRGNIIAPCARVAPLPRSCYEILHSVHRPHTHRTHTIPIFARVWRAGDKCAPIPHDTQQHKRALTLKLFI